METFVYFIGQGYGLVKIGVARDPERRILNLQTGNGKALKLIATFPFSSRSDAVCVERELHRKYASYRVNGEWFRPGVLKAIRNGMKPLDARKNKPEWKKMSGVLQKTSRRNERICDLIASIKANEDASGYWKTIAEGCEIEYPDNQKNYLRRFFGER